MDPASESPAAQRLRSRLLEFLKFRVLAPLWPEALALADGNLRSCLEDARRLDLP